jgi:hypothetical protein
VRRSGGRSGRERLNREIRNGPNWHPIADHLPRCTSWCKGSRWVAGQAPASLRQRESPDIDPSNVSLLACDPGSVTGDPAFLAAGLRRGNAVLQPTADSTPHQYEPPGPHPSPIPPNRSLADGQCHPTCSVPIQLRMILDTILHSRGRGRGGGRRQGPPCRAGHDLCRHAVAGRRMSAGIRHLPQRTRAPNATPTCWSSAQARPG